MLAHVGVARLSSTKGPGNIPGHRMLKVEPSGASGPLRRGRGISPAIDSAVSGLRQVKSSSTKGPGNIPGHFNKKGKAGHVVNPLRRGRGISPAIPSRARRTTGLCILYEGAGEYPRPLRLMRRWRTGRRVLYEGAGEYPRPCPWRAGMFASSVAILYEGAGEYPRPSTSILYCFHLQKQHPIANAHEKMVERGSCTICLPVKSYADLP